MPREKARVSVSAGLASADEAEADQLLLAHLEELFPEIESGLLLRWMMLTLDEQWRLQHYALNN